MGKNIQQRFSFAIPADDSVDVIMRRLPSSDLITVADIASAMDVSSTTVREWIEDGSLPALPAGAGEQRMYYKISRNTFYSFLKLRKEGLI